MALTMKEFFKYEYGFVNIDSENFYLTNSGNWSETKTLYEKSGKGNIKQNARRIRIIAFFVIAIAIFIILFISQIASSKIFLGLPIAGYFLYRYLRNEMGVACYIPINKIESFKITDKDCLINFRNKENKPDTALLTNVEDKGHALIQSLGLKTYS